MFFIFFFWHPTWALGLISYAQRVYIPSQCAGQNEYRTISCLVPLPFSHLCPSSAPHPSSCYPILHYLIHVTFWWNFWRNSLWRSAGCKNWWWRPLCKEILNACSISYIIGTGFYIAKWERNTTKRYAHKWKEMNDIRQIVAWKRKAVNYVRKTRWGPSDQAYQILIWENNIRSLESYMGQETLRDHSTLFLNQYKRHRRTACYYYCICNALENS